MLAREEKRISRAHNETTLKRVISGRIQGGSTLPRKRSREGAATVGVYWGRAQPPQGKSEPFPPTCGSHSAWPALGHCLSPSPGSTTDPLRPWLPAPQQGESVLAPGTGAHHSDPAGTDAQSNTSKLGKTN